MKKKIVIGCDDAAVEMKNALCALLLEEGYEVEDVGVDSPEDHTYYPEIAQRACKKIIASSYTKQGILICGTGLGMAMAANKFPGIFAGVCHDVYSAERLRLSNNGNVLCLGARVIGTEVAKRVVKLWLPLEFVNGSSTPKVELLRKIDAATRC